MGRRTDTRERTLRAAARLLRARGYHGTGLNQVLAEGDLPKGSLYFHFPGGKEQLAAEAVAMAGAELRAWIESRLESAPDAAAGVEAVVSGIADHLEATGYRVGCPVGMVAHDSREHEAVRAACAAAFESWQGVLRDFLARHGVPGPDAVATALLAAIEGGQLLARTRCDTAPLRAVATTMGPLLGREPR